MPITPTTASPLANTPAMPASNPTTPGDPLAGLIDIHLPDPVGFWPLAPGWWILAALLLGGIIAGCLYWRLQRARNAYRRQALEQLDLLETDQSNDSQWLQSLNQLLKRSAQSAHANGYVADNPAGLHGAGWRVFLERHNMKHTAVSPDVMRLLTEGGYQSDESIASDLQQHRPALLTFIRHWLSQHSLPKVDAETAAPTRDNPAC